MNGRWAKKSPDFDGKRYGRNFALALGFHEDKDGDIVFKAKTNAVIKTKAGDVIEKTMAVFDKKGKPMDEEMEVGNGSTIRLCMLLRPFYASATVYGIQLLLKAVQVLNYVAPAAGVVSADDCGFDVEEEFDEDILRLQPLRVQTFKSLWLLNLIVEVALLPSTNPIVAV